MPPDDPAPAVTVQPLLHVDNLNAAVDFYRTFGATVVFAEPDGDFVLLSLGGTQLALLAHPPNPAEQTGPIELTLATDSLDTLIPRAIEAGIPFEGEITKTAFGRQVKVTTPDGQALKINEFPRR